MPDYPSIVTNDPLGEGTIRLAGPAAFVLDSPDFDRGFLHRQIFFGTLHDLWGIGELLISLYRTDQQCWLTVQWAERRAQLDRECLDEEILEQVEEGRLGFISGTVDIEWAVATQHFQPGKEDHLLCFPFGVFRVRGETTTMVVPPDRLRQLGKPKTIYDGPVPAWLYVLTAWRLRRTGVWTLGDLGSPPGWKRLDCTSWSSLWAKEKGRENYFEVNEVGGEQVVIQNFFAYLSDAMALPRFKRWPAWLFLLLDYRTWRVPPLGASENPFLAG